MVENVKRFVKALDEDQELAKKFEETLKNVVEAREAGSDAEAFSRAAQALGFDLSVSDLERAQAETQEIDPEELSGTAGGWCVADYDCYTAWHHDTPDSKGTSCLKDHDCMSSCWNKPDSQGTGVLPGSRQHVRYATTLKIPGRGRGNCGKPRSAVTVL